MQPAGAHEAAGCDGVGVRWLDLKINDHVIKGYRATGADSLADAWRRYLPPSATQLASQVAAVADTTNPEGGISMADRLLRCWGLPSGSLAA